ncbi:MAG: ATP-grasp domain-containing protein [Pseudomonadota bacterium]
MTVHILYDDTVKRSVNWLAADIGFSQKGYEIRPFAMADFEDVELEPGDIVVGGVGIVRQGMARLGFEVPSLPGVPEPLLPFAGRMLWQDTIGALRKRVQAGEAIFAKPPADQPKRFTGKVLSSVRDLIETAHLPDDARLDCSEPVRFLAEYRVFIRWGEILGVRPYNGDPLLFPDPDVIRAALAAYADAPASYTLDMGVTDDGRTLLVEVNDSYATGAYGLDPLRYAEFIEARWDELARTA